VTWASNDFSSPQAEKYQQARTHLIRLQSWFRGLAQEKKYKQTIACLISLQSVYRGFAQQKKYTQTRAEIERIREEKNKEEAKAEEKREEEMKYTEMDTTKKFRAFASLPSVVTWASNDFSSPQAEKYQQARTHLIRLQSWFRGLAQEKKYKQTIACLISLQSVYRGFAQQKKYTQTRAEIERIREEKELEKKKRQEEKDKKRRLESMSRTHNEANTAFFEEACDVVLQQIIDAKGMQAACMAEALFPSVVALMRKVEQHLKISTGILTTNKWKDQFQGWLKEWTDFFDVLAERLLQSKSEAMLYISPELFAAEIAKIGLFSNFAMDSFSYDRDVVDHSSNAHRFNPDKLYRLTAMQEWMKRLPRVEQKKMMVDKEKQVHTCLRASKLNTMWSTNGFEHFDMLKNLISQHMFVAYVVEYIVRR